MSEQPRLAVNVRPPSTLDNARRRIFERTIRAEDLEDRVKEEIQIRLNALESRIEKLKEEKSAKTKEKKVLEARLKDAEDKRRSKVTEHERKHKASADKILALRQHENDLKLRGDRASNLLKRVSLLSIPESELFANVLVHV